MNTSIPSERLLVEERRRHIVKLINDNGRATVDELSERFNISAVTIRGDLEILDREGRITRTRGGALPTFVNSVDTPLRVKENRNFAEKTRIGTAAAELIQDGETIILDSGSTTAEIAHQIHDHDWRSLTVITNALNIALELHDHPNIRVMMLGGMLRPTSQSLAGPDAEQTLSRLTADRLFLGVDGLDPQIGLTTPDPQEAALNTLMIRVSRQVIAVLDASKLGQRSMSLIAPIDDLDVVITDSDAKPEVIETLSSRGVQVITV